MTPDVADTDTITVNVPIAFRKRSGRKTVDAPARLPTSKIPSGDEALIKALARSYRWRTLIETGVHSTVAELAAAEKVNPSYASRILRLTLLAPEIVEEILDRRSNRGITLDRLMQPFPVAWGRQRRPSARPVVRSAFRQ